MQIIAPYIQLRLKAGPEQDRDGPNDLEHVGTLFGITD